jgi:hypothetical protein
MYNAIEIWLKEARNMLNNSAKQFRNLIILLITRYLLKVEFSSLNSSHRDVTGKGEVISSTLFTAFLLELSFPMITNIVKKMMTKKIFFLFNYRDRRNLNGLFVFQILRDQ